MGLGGAGLVGIVAAYEFLPHVRARIERFLDKSSGDTFQVDTAMESFSRGGWLGRGPGEGTVKRILPDAHTDFIFAVTAEEFGIVVCMSCCCSSPSSSCAASSLARRKRGHVLPPRGDGPRPHVRPAGLHQHDGERSPHAGEGHDAAVHLLWRFVAALACARHGLPHRATRRRPRAEMMDRFNQDWPRG